jgi:hypothetical protein
VLADELVWGALVLPFPPCPQKKRHKKKQGAGACFIFDTLSIILVVSGPPFGGLVCLGKCQDDVIDCSCESAGQSVYGPRIGFLGHFGSSGVRLMVVLLVIVWPVVFDVPIHDGSLDLCVFCAFYVLYIHLLYIMYSYFGKVQHISNILPAPGS